MESLLMPHALHYTGQPLDRADHLRETDIRALLSATACGCCRYGVAAIRSMVLERLCGALRRDVRAGVPRA